MFALTAGTLGLGFAAAKTTAAVGVGLLGGFGIAAIGRVDLLGAALRPGIGDGGCAAAKVRQPQSVVWAFWREAGRRSKFNTMAMSSFVFLGKWLLLAFLLESLMLAYVPAEFVARLAGGDGLGPVVLAALAGVPAYVNGAAALPLVAGLVEQGMSPGAAMAFLVGGCVTSIPAAIAVFAAARPPVFAAYLGFAILGAVLSGLAYGSLG